MFALAAVITFILGFILSLMGVSTGHVNLVYLGLAFLAAAHVPWGPWAARNTP